MASRRERERESAGSTLIFTQVCFLFLLFRFFGLHKKTGNEEQALSSNFSAFPPCQLEGLEVGGVSCDFLMPWLGLVRLV